MLESRSPFTNPLGKCTAECKAKVPEETKELFDRLAAQNGMTASELLREMIIARVHGENMLRSLYERRLAVVSSAGPDQAT
jgi:predicted DNA-binding protein